MIGASEAFGLLSDDVRRRLLLLLRDEEPLELPDAVLSRGGGVSANLGGSGIDEGRRRQVIETRLHHVHLPKLVSTGVVTWNRQAGTAARGPRYDEIEPLLGVLASNAAAVPQDVF